MAEVRIGCVGYPRAGRKTVLRGICQAAGCPMPSNVADWYPTVHVTWPGARMNHDLRVRLLEDSGSFSHGGEYELDELDVRDALDEGAGGELHFLSGAHGLFYIVDPRAQRVHLSEGRLRLLWRDVWATGRDPATVPMIFVVTRQELDAGERMTEGFLKDRFFWPRAEWAFVNGVTGEGCRHAVDALLARTEICSGELPMNVATIEREKLVFSAPPVRTEITGLINDACLLGLWREARTPDLAELICAASYSRRSIRAASFSHSDWCDRCRARRSEDLPVLLDTLLLRDEKGYLADHASQVVERCQGLCWWEEDPRITVRVGSILADVTRYRRAAVVDGLCRILVRHSDPSGVNLLARLYDDLQKIREPLGARAPKIFKFVERAHARMSKRFPGIHPAGIAILPEHQDAWQSLVDRIRRPLPRPEDMAAIAADPKNDDLRRELAERMRERGDPRGEFILLQLEKATGSLSPEEHEREQALKRTYAWDWLGPLADVVDVENSVFERGYPVKLTVWTPNTRALADVVGAPEWATVREIRWGGDPCWEEEKPDAELIEHPIMRSLEKVTTKMPDDPAELEALRRVAWAR